MTTRSSSIGSFPLIARVATSRVSDITPDEARSVAKEAFVYGFAFVENYRSLYKQAVDSNDPDYNASFNQIGHSRKVATPADKQFVTPNSDTPYSYIWFDLRAEPVVVTMPKIDQDRYYTAQLVDLQLFNFAYLGTRSYGNDGGDFLIAGPDWQGDQPKGVKEVIRCETQFAYALIRTQLFNANDLDNVHRIQDGYEVQLLSKYLGSATTPAAPTIDWPKPSDKMSTSPEMFEYLNFLLQFCAPHPSEAELQKRFVELGIGAGMKFQFEGLPVEIQSSIETGIREVASDEELLMKRLNRLEITSADLFGSRESLKNNYMYRFMGAKIGIYGNTASEAVYPGYFVDVHGQVPDASKTKHGLRFEKGQLPPASAFWSITMYDGKTKHLVANSLDRYLLNSTMLKSFKFADDGSLTVSVQKDSPGADKEANWLPAPDGPFYIVMRIYFPKAEALNGTWRKPDLVPTK
jgi:hypothetical protein